MDWAGPVMDWAISEPEPRGSGRGRWQHWNVGKKKAWAVGTHDKALIKLAHGVSWKIV